MTEFDLGPAFIRIDYSSLWGAHTMTIPSVPVTGATDPAPFFTLRGLEAPVNVNTAVADFVNILKGLFLASTTFKNATLFTKAGVGDPAVPTHIIPLNIAGTNGGTTLMNEATQATYTFRAEDFNLFKLVLLDTPIIADVRPVVTWGAGSPQQNLIDYVVADASWIASRSGAAPKVFLKTAFTLNEKLRRSYKMT